MALLLGRALLWRHCASALGQAVDYVWEQLQAACLSPQCRPVFRRIEALRSALLHRCCIRG